MNKREFIKTLGKGAAIVGAGTLSLGAKPRPRRHCMNTVGYEEPPRPTPPYQWVLTGETVDGHRFRVDVWYAPLADKYICTHITSKTEYREQRISKITPKQYRDIMRSTPARFAIHTMRWGERYNAWEK